MRFVCQQEALSAIQDIAKSDRHSILIDGVEGSGKTYIAAQFAKLKDIEEFHVIDPTVQSIRAAIDECYQIKVPIVLCIENIDLGVISASYTLLKFFEEPDPNVYIVVTCRNRNKVPDTIISRSVCVTTSPPIDSDVALFSENRDASVYYRLKDSPIWRCVRTFKDATTVLKMSADQINYFYELEKVAKFKDSVANIVWTLGHYSDNTETPLELVITYIMNYLNTNHVRMAGIDCIRDLSYGRVAKHAVLARFVLECKYCE